MDIKEGTQRTWCEPRKQKEYRMPLKIGKFISFLLAIPKPVYVHNITWSPRAVDNTNHENADKTDSFKGLRKKTWRCQHERLNRSQPSPERTIKDMLCSGGDWSSMLTRARRSHRDGQPHPPVDEMQRHLRVPETLCVLTADTWRSHHDIVHV